MGQISFVKSFLKAGKSCRRLRARRKLICIIVSLSCKILHLNTTQLFCFHILHNAWASNTELRFATFQVYDCICQLIFLFNQKDMPVSLKKNIIAKNVISFLCPEMFLLPLDNGINPRTPVSSCFQSLVHGVLVMSSSDNPLHCRLKVPFVFPVLPDSRGARISSGTCHWTSVWAASRFRLG